MSNIADDINPLPAMLSYVGPIYVNTRCVSLAQVWSLF